MAMEHPSERAVEALKSALNAAFRTALACTIVQLTTLYAPSPIRAAVAFPAFSYVAAVLVVTNAAVGDAVKGCWLAAYATVQGVCPAILCLWVVGPARLTPASTAAALAVSAFFVALPDWTHPVAKRIALGQLVIVYVVGFIGGGATQAVAHPAHVAASTAVGVVASLLALVVPYPYLACYEVKQNCKAFAGVSSARLKLLVAAFSSDDHPSSTSLQFQANSFAIKSSKILQTLKSKQQAMQWEKLPFKTLKSFCINPSDRFQTLQTLFNGMEFALATSKLPKPAIFSSPNTMDELKHLETDINLHLHRIEKCNVNDSSTVVEPKSEEISMKFEEPPKKEDLPFFFFLFILNLMKAESKKILFSGSKRDESQSSWRMMRLESLNKMNLISALKCSFSLGFAVFLGLLYSKDDGFWAGLPVAISFASAREPTFKVTNLKFQGTVIGTIYGVLGCFVFQRFESFKFLALLPWFIFTSFLQKSKMYGQAGAISAVIGAVLILGRKDFGAPSEFAITRIVETFIGLSCSIMVDLIVQPTRATSLAKIQLSKVFGDLHDCALSSVDLDSCKVKMVESQKRLKSAIAELKKLIEDAEAEPSFWFTPFHGSCYGKIVERLSRMSDLLVFASRSIEIVEDLDELSEDIEICRETVTCSFKMLKEITSMKSLSSALEKKSCRDLEMGKMGDFRLDFGDEDLDEFTSSLIDHIGDSVGIQSEDEDEEERMIEGELVIGVGGLGFCLMSLMRETREVGLLVKEVVQWENPLMRVDLNEIYCKLHGFGNLIDEKNSF